MAAEQQPPFALKAPNADSRVAMEEARRISKARFASAKALTGDADINDLAADLASGMVLLPGTACAVEVRWRAGAPVDYEADLQWRSKGSNRAPPSPSVTA